MPDQALSIVTQVVAAYAAATVALVLLDLVWLGLVSRRRTSRVRGQELQFGRPRAHLGLWVYGLFAIGLLLLAQSTPERGDAAPSSSQRSSIVATAAPAPT